MTHDGLFAKAEARIEAARRQAEARPSGACGSGSWANRWPAPARPAAPLRLPDPLHRAARALRGRIGRST